MRGWSDMPSKIPAKIALLSLLFFGTMMFWHWEAMLISYLATRVVTLPFQDLADLVANTDFRIILIPGTSQENAFSESLDPIWQKAWKERVEPHLEEHVGMKNQNFADQMERDSDSAWYSNFFSAS